VGPTTPNYCCINVHNLRSFYDKLESCIRGLSSLGKSEEGYGELLVPLILEKLPEDTRRQLTRSHGSNDWSLAEIRKSHSSEIEVLQSSERKDTNSVDYSTDYSVTSLATPPLPHIFQATEKKSNPQIPVGRDISLTSKTNI
jgi:hypothetical protein